MRNVLIVTQCDWCFTDVPEGQSISVRLVGGRDEYEGDVCGECYSGLIVPMRKAKRVKKAKGEKGVCWYCDKTYTAHYLKEHIRRAHEGIL